MQTTIQKFAGFPEHAEADMCIVAILSHGKVKKSSHKNERNFISTIL